MCESTITTTAWSPPTQGQYIVIKAIPVTGAAFICRFHYGSSVVHPSFLTLHFDAVDMITIPTCMLMCDTESIGIREISMLLNCFDKVRGLG